MLRNILDLVVFIVKPVSASKPVVSRPTSRAKPLRMQTVYNSSTIAIPNKHQPVLDHFSLQNTRPTSCKFTKGTTFIGFNTITEGNVLVFPMDARHSPIVWKQLIDYAKQHNVGIGTLHLTQDTACQQISKWDVTVLLIESSVLTGGRSLYKNCRAD